jgi:hypothetical protein
LAWSKAGARACREINAAVAIAPNPQETLRKKK